MDDGAALAYAADGPAGAPGLLLLHGLASNGTRWAEFAHTTTLRADRRILRPDLRGHGASIWRGRITLERWCADLSALLDAEGLGRVAVAGHSLGAAVALRFARADPRVERLILLDPVYPAALAGSLKTVRRIRPLLRAAAFGILALNRLGLRRRRFPVLDLTELDAFARRMQAEGRPEEWRKRYAAPWVDLRYLPVSTYLQDLAELVRDPPPPEALPMPVLTLLAREPVVTRGEATRAMLARLPRGRIVDIDAAHWVLTEAPEAARAAIEGFCRES